MRGGEWKGEREWLVLSGYIVKLTGMSALQVGSSLVDLVRGMILFF